MSRVHMLVNGPLCKDASAYPAKMSTAWARHMIATFGLLSQDVAGRASLDVVGLSPFLGESFLLRWVALNSPLLAGHTLMRLFVARGTDLRKA